LAWGAFHCTTVFQGLNQSSSLAKRSQKRAGFRAASLYTDALLTLARLTNSFGGGNRRFSFRRASTALLPLVSLAIGDLVLG
jgi:hypothetical protein